MTIEQPSLGKAQREVLEMLREGGTIAMYFLEYHAPELRDAKGDYHSWRINAPRFRLLRPYLDGTVEEWRVVFRINAAGLRALESTQA